MDDTSLQNQAHANPITNTDEPVDFQVEMSPATQPEIVEKPQAANKLPKPHDNMRATEPISAMKIVAQMQKEEAKKTEVRSELASIPQIDRISEADKISLEKNAPLLRLFDRLGKMSTALDTKLDNKIMQMLDTGRQKASDLTIDDLKRTLAVGAVFVGSEIVKRQGYHAGDVDLNTVIDLTRGAIRGYHTGVVSGRTEHFVPKAQQGRGLRAASILGDVAAGVALSAATNHLIDTASDTTNLDPTIVDKVTEKGTEIAKQVLRRSNKG